MSKLLGGVETQTVKRDCNNNLKESPKIPAEEEIELAKEKQQPVEEKQPKPYTKIMQEK